MTFSQCFVVGLLSAVAVFSLLTCIRNSWRNEIIRICRSEEYLTGWRDAIKHAKSQFQTWVKDEPEERK